MISNSLEQVSRHEMLKAAHAAAKHRYRGMQLWSFVGSICGVGSGTATEICKELGWNPFALATDELPSFEHETP